MLSERKEISFKSLNCLLLRNEYLAYKIDHNSVQNTSLSCTTTMPETFFLNRYFRTMTHFFRILNIDGRR